MESPERKHGKREDSSEAREEDDEEEIETNEKKHKSNRNRKSSAEDMESYDDAGRRRGEPRKRSSGHAHSEDDDYDTKRDSRSRRKLEESSLEKLSSWYQDGDSEKTRSKSSSKDKYDDERKDKAYRSTSRRRWDDSDTSAVSDSRRSDSDRGKSKDDSRQRRSSSIRDESDRSHGRRSKDGESPHHRSREYARENDRSSHGRSREEALKTSSNYSNDDYDVIEIQTKPVDGKSIPKGIGRGRGRGVRDGQQPMGLPMPMMGSPFGPMGPMPPMNLNTPTPISPGVFIPPFSPPIVWPGARVDMSMMRFPPPANAFFNQVRGMPPLVRGPFPDRPWLPPRAMPPLGKAPSRGEQNDYSQNFVDTGMRPQNFIRELELTNVVEDYPKLRELIQKKDEIVANSATPPMYMNCDLKTFDLSPEFFGSKFDVILIDPPWEEYVHRAPGVADHLEYWTFEEILNLKIEAVADTPSFIFLWVGDCVGLEQGRQCLKKWGFRRCEDICWVKTNKANATPGIRHDSHTLFQHSKEHCLMGIKGTVRRSTDGHIIHANIDTDVIIAEEPPYGSTRKPDDMYRIIEHFALGRRRLELFGEEHNIRAGWVTLGKELSSSNFNAEGYVKNFSDKEGKVWQGGSGRNPPPEAPHLVMTTPDIEALRPKSPMKNQAAPVAVMATATAGKTLIGSSSNPATPLVWPVPVDTSRTNIDDSYAVAPPSAFSDVFTFDPQTQSPVAFS